MFKLIPDEMRQLEIHFINAPMKKDSNNQFVRPTTENTIENWLKAYPPVGHYLAVSSFPYLKRHDLVTRTIAPHGFDFDTVGPAAIDEKMAAFVDELARLIYQIKQIAEKN
jgi:hypothetical protein